LAFYKRTQNPNPDYESKVCSRINPNQITDAHINRLNSIRSDSYSHRKKRYEPFEADTEDLVEANTQANTKETNDAMDELFGITESVESNKQNETIVNQVFEKFLPGKKQEDEPTDKQVGIKFAEEFMTSNKKKKASNNVLRTSLRDGYH